uniref:G2 and S-phase expressed 1 n=1 Tax=Labrus bergylta TaxID=56723 RepID=A0A3Q3EFQ1_9LABR
MSPASSKGDEDEDEVFVGPLSHKEKCVSVKVASRVEGSDCARVSWSPLTGDLLDAVCQEAHKLADQIQSCELSQSHGEAGEPSAATNRREDTLSPIKRQTFLVQDSPLKQLPPAVQRRLLRGSSNSTAPSPSPATSSSKHPASALPRMGLRGKAALGVVLPSKPAGPRAPCSASKSRVDRTRLQPLSKALGTWKRSPSSRPSSLADSSEDLLSDSASVASDISDSSFNSSLLGKRTMAPPSKVRLNMSAVKVPPLQSRRVTDRKNTSSSSSSVSSFNSSISLSPAKGKLNSSLNQSLSGSTGPAPSSITKPSNPSRTNRSSVYGTARPASSNAGRRSLSTQARKPSEVELPKTTKCRPLKRAETTPLQVTPAKRLSERTASIPSSSSTRLQSGLKTKSKPEALVLPTPSGGFRGVAQKDGENTSKMIHLKRQMSTSSVESLPQKASAGPVTPSAGSGRVLPMKARRPSALPTPVKRRMSAIPPATPTNLTLPSRPSTTSDSGPAPCHSVARREKSCSPTPAETQEAELVVALEVRPFCLEEEEESTAAPPPSLPHTDQSESIEPVSEPIQVEPAPSRDLIELGSTGESNTKTQEVLLLDLPAPIVHPQEKLLIDLTNTPDLIRTSGKTCPSSQQLIDLTSPLIKWSPEDKRENNAPLINLSF